MCNGIADSEADAEEYEYTATSVNTLTGEQNFPDFLVL